MTKRKESVKDDKISRKEIISYVVIGVIVLALLLAYWEGMRYVRQGYIDTFGFWKAFLGIYH